MIYCLGKEEWRDVPSTPGIAASSWGRLMVVPYEKAMPRGGVKTIGGFATFGHLREGRFHYAVKKREYKAHRLICEAFNGPPKDGQVCMHLDENCLNNLPRNLKWGTQKENLNAPGFLAYCRSRLGDASPVGKSKKKTANVFRGESE